jgi:flagellar hook-associated protein 2
MPVTLGGVASGMDTEGIIKKLVEVESKPIRKLQREKQEYNVKKGALKELGSVLTKLDDSVKELYGFRASYEDKKALSSDESIVNATATKHATIGSRKIEVLQLASTHRIVSDPIDKDMKIPSGKFRIEVNGENELVKFRGGTIKKLKEKIEEAAGSLVNVQSVNTSGNKYVLTVESKVEGEKGELKITGDKNFLKKIGLIKGEKAANKNIVNLIFDNKFFTSYMGDETVPKKRGSLKVGRDGKSVTLTSALWQEYALPKKIKLKKNTAFEFKSEYTEPKPPEKIDEALPFRMEFGPEIKTVIKGIELKSYNVSRNRPIEKKKPKPKIDNIFGIGIIITDKDGKRIEKIYPLRSDVKGKQEIPIGSDFAGKELTKVIFYCNDGKTKFSDARVATPVKTKNLLDPKNVVAKAQDAKFKVDGIEITRDKNDNISDVIKGVALNLKNARPGSPIDLKIDHDLEKAIKKINKFIENYNNYVEFHHQLTKAAKAKKSGNYRQNKKDSGMFVGDMTLMRLRNSLAMNVSSAYRSKADKPVKMLVEVGISTGKVNSSWDKIKQGKLVLDEELFLDKVKNNPEGVKDLFGADTDGDNRVDTGFGFSMNRSLKPYVKSGKNIIASHVELQDESIKMADQRIEKLEKHLEAYEQKLKRKFGKMERVMSGAKAQKQWMKQQQGGNSK